MGLADFLFRSEKKRQLKKLEVTADKIEKLSDKYGAMSDEELSAQTAALKARYAAGETLDELLPDAFAVVREAGARVLNMRHFHVQLLGGIVLHQGRIAEMQTGEGKTLVATLPAYLNALSGKGVHIVTVNDYLAKRDAEWMGKIYKFLGMSVGVVTQGMSNAERKAAYAADITYATNNEIGFDYLRDNMVTEREKAVQRGHEFAIVDEVDSILIDEARTPLIISAMAGESGELYVQTDRFVKSLDGDEDVIKDEKDNHVYLSEQGVEKAERYFRIDNLGDAENAELSMRINSALRANYLMHLNKDYIVENGEIIIVDEFTGRKMSGRRYSDGLHQAIEAKEQVAIRKENKTIATITFQNFFRLYKKLSGMTGTAMTEEAEFRGIYELDVVPIPPNLKVVRVDEADKIFRTKAEKYAAVIEDVREAHEKGQPVLVGTTNVAASEELSDLLRKERIPHNVLNAKHHTEEAAIIAQAGREGAVTIATNMAGRGTDILLGGNPEFMAKQKMEKEGFTPELIETASAFNAVSAEEEVNARARYNELIAEFKKETDAAKEKVRELGGLRVIGTERHEARRIDNQLRGRSGRQGDPGSSCFYLSFEDDLLRIFGGDRLKGLMGEGQMLQVSILSKQIEVAQRRCEENNYAIRKHVLNYDDVMNKQRQLIYAERNAVLDGKDVHEQILKYFEPLALSIVGTFVNYDESEEEVDIASFNSALELKLLEKGTGLITPELLTELSEEKIEELVLETTIKQYEAKMKKAEENRIDFKRTERNVLLNQVDRQWMNHISNMDALRKGIGLRGYGQKDPVMEYRREGFEMFDAMIETIQDNTAMILAKLDVDAAIERINLYTREQQRRVTVVNTEKKKQPGRNDPCPCGSGKKYKNCCGR
ncbi:MAG: preprotein translocase subunit SecA [Firmicutes bacterium]|uniref:Protein translocase subunit SecA n=1 Tax=Candidatus Stercoripulliclostridium pullicola TaxID=2840953 RepID=A0A940ICS2_9FIRM|nr:preprotein translocase subunit SecA [Candidatus Stercoripulliclostridium pullicola]